MQPASLSSWQRSGCEKTWAEKKEEEKIRLQSNAAIWHKLKMRRGGWTPFSSVWGGKERVALSSCGILAPKPLKHHLFTFYPQLGCASGVPPLTTPLQKVWPTRPCQHLCARPGSCVYKLLTVQVKKSQSLSFPAKTDNSITFLQRPVYCAQ